jgi:hypothetical protein
MAVPAAAAPILSGEGVLESFLVPGAIIRVDFEVYAPFDAAAPLGAIPAFTYVYQVEATTGPTGPGGALNDVSSFTVNFLAEPFFAAGTFGGTLAIGSEIHPLTLAPLACCTAGALGALDASNVNWTFTPNIPSGGQSDLLIGLALSGPTKGSASALDGLPGSPWSTAVAPLGTFVPVPIPEPATLLLLGLGLGTLGLAARKK